MHYFVFQLSAAYSDAYVVCLYNIQCACTYRIYTARGIATAGSEISI